MPLGMEVGIGPGHIVLDGDPALPQRKGAQHSPLFYLHNCVLCYLNCTGSQHWQAFCISLAACLWFSFDIHISILYTSFKANTDSICNVFDICMFNDSIGRGHLINYIFPCFSQGLRNSAQSLQLRVD